MGSEDEVKVLGVWASPFVLRLVIALEEKGIKYEYVEQDLGSKSPLLLETNPVNKQVPVLIHNGRPVVESAIILQYIDEVWSNGPAFLPSDPYDRAMARFWTYFIDKKVIESWRDIWLCKGEKHQEAKRQVTESLTILEENLKGKDYFGGSTFGIVDIAFAPLICWFHTYETIGDLKFMFEDKFPNIFAWMKKCMERESITTKLPQPERVLEMATKLRNVLLRDNA